MLFPALYVQAEETGSLSLECKIGKGTYSLYRVAAFTETEEFKLEKPFSDYQVQLEGLDNEGWRALAETLSGYVERDGLQPFDTKEVDEQGRVKWENLQRGLYLVLGEKVKDEQYVYTPMPSLVTVPNRSEDGTWNDQVVIRPKYNQEEIQQEEKTDYTVIKIWKDKQNKKVRPEKIQVQLLQDGKIYDTVELNEKNNWKYTWKQLHTGFKWTVVEKEVPKNYTVTSTQEKTSFVIKNTYTAPGENGENGGSGGNGGSGSGGSGGGSGKPGLPQTGQLWWPVPVLTVLGFLLFVIALRKRK